MFRIALSMSLLMASTACSSALGLNDVTRGDGGTDLDRISALEGKLAMMQAALEPIVFRASLGTAQTVHTGEATVVAFDKIELDTRRAFDARAHQYVIPEPGLYLITAIIGYATMNKARANCEISVIKQDQTEVGLTAVTTPGNSSGTGASLLRVASATVAQLAAGDRVYIRAFHDYGSDQTLTTDPRETNVQVIRIPSVN